MNRFLEIFCKNSVGIAARDGPVRQPSAEPTPDGSTCWSRWCRRRDARRSAVNPISSSYIFFIWSSTGAENNLPLTIIVIYQILLNPFVQYSSHPPHSLLIDLADCDTVVCTSTLYHTHFSSPEHVLTRSPLCSSCLSVFSESLTFFL